MKVISLEDTARTAVDRPGAQNLWKQVPISARDGSPSFSMRVFTVDPDGHTPYHSHASEHLNYVIRGSGALVTESGHEHALKEGDFALVLPHEKHRYRNTSADGPLVIICAVPKEYE